MIFQIGQGMIAQNHLFPEKDPPFGREASHQMLRPLRNKIPSQMGKTD
jgi:hypothetical protein